MRLFALLVLIALLAAPVGCRKTIREARASAAATASSAVGGQLP